MKSLFPLLFVIIILFSTCRKSESDFIWEKSYGMGEALFIRTSPDSGFSACGELGGNPYFVRLDKTRSLIIDFKADIPGLFNSAWFDTSVYITGGNTAGKMLLMCYDKEGNNLWEKSIDAGFQIDYTNLFYTDNGTLLAIGTASPDSLGSGAAGLLFVRFDTTGLIISEKKITETSFISANNAVIDNAGNIFLAMTRKGQGTKTMAGVAKFNVLFQKLWETELYTNPGFGSASIAIDLDGSGNIFVAGKTELSVENGIINNSFLVSLSASGSLKWKRYIENSNSGSSLIFNNTGDLMMLNRNCFIISIVDPDDGADAGRIRMFSICNSYDSDAFGTSMAINYDKNILVAGSLGKSFYLALKASQ